MRSDLLLVALIIVALVIGAGWKLKGAGENIVKKVVAERLAVIDGK